MQFLDTVTKEGWAKLIKKLGNTTEPVVIKHPEGWNDTDTAAPIALQLETQGRDVLGGALGLFLAGLVCFVVFKLAQRAHRRIRGYNAIGREESSTTVV
ncbi:Aste57867_22976 [Aphanomyces stellatus]|uniref:Aste57867_22976 protein n=1 Tax=Aphanomyces stellatus TaxID=120398 RepID=A0A485LLM7_9STRA|nr:hypothetical protein As57867_022905 [Aphanomyces stellatus]VFT99626.1 Aste57867_22976 [Aphanomyces stellatus]